MSGGSYDYLYLQSDDLSRNRRMIEEMARRLEGLPYASEAATDTRRILTLLADAQALAERLADVWRAVEWWDSGDYGEDDAQDAIAKYRSASTTT